MSDAEDNFILVSEEELLRLPTRKYVRRSRKRTTPPTPQPSKRYRQDTEPTQADSAQAQRPVTTVQDLFDLLRTMNSEERKSFRELVCIDTADGKPIHRNAIDLNTSKAALRAEEHYKRFQKDWECCACRILGLVSYPSKPYKWRVDVAPHVEEAWDALTKKYCWLEPIHKPCVLRMFYEAMRTRNAQYARTHKKCKASSAEDTEDDQGNDNGAGDSDDNDLLGNTSSASSEQAARLGALPQHGSSWESSGQRNTPPADSITGSTQPLHGAGACGSGGTQAQGTPAPKTAGASRKRLVLFRDDETGEEVFMTDVA